MEVEDEEEKAVQESKGQRYFNKFSHNKLNTEMTKLSTADCDKQGAVTKDRRLGNPSPPL